MKKAFALILFGIVILMLISCSSDDATFVVKNTETPWNEQGQPICTISIDDDVLGGVGAGKSTTFSLDQGSRRVHFYYSYSYQYTETIYFGSGDKITYNVSYGGVTPAKASMKLY
ncbi:hypothetical protein KAU32_12625 [bacterium]|nr:hypothetical protein [bacterium]